MEIYTEDSLHSHHIYLQIKTKNLKMIHFIFKYTHTPWRISNSSSVLLTCFPAQLANQNDNLPQNLCE